jgi:hypothetical protein
MTNANICMEMNGPHSAVEALAGSARFRGAQAGMPDREAWQRRLEDLQAEQGELEDMIAEDGLGSEALRSAVHRRRQEILTRVADLQWLISRGRN